MRIVGYCSTTTYSQNVNTQKKAILAAFPEATIMIDHRNHDDDGLFEKKWDKMLWDNWKPYQVKVEGLLSSGLLVQGEWVGNP